MANLLDVNSLIALLDSDHVRHGVMQRWFDEHSRDGWATCPITENGLIRVVSHANYPSGRRSPAEIVNTLRHLKLARADSHQFWPDAVTLTDETLFRCQYLVGSRQVTDAYLLGLAAKRGGTLVSFDGSLPWQAIQGAARSLVQKPA